MVDLVQYVFVLMVTTSVNYSCSLRHIPERFKWKVPITSRLFQNYLSGRSFGSVCGCSSSANSCDAIMVLESDCICSRACEADRAIRSRAEPRATVGKRIAGARKPFWKRVSANRRVCRSSPINQGKIGLTGSGISPEAGARHLTRNRTLRQRRDRSLSPSAVRTISRAADAAAAEAGGRAVE